MQKMQTMQTLCNYFKEKMRTDIEYQKMMIAMVGEDYIKKHIDNKFFVGKKNVPRHLKISRIILKRATLYDRQLLGKIKSDYLAYQIKSQ